ncbi:MAG TPA: hypothetical protein PKN50_18870 [Spirochaetota bacterium]|nr:hypothetical protein [Spirochaetota bacterium]HPV40038.1 hypothetical protein [Spirochaetota bacterium]
MKRTIIVMMAAVFMAGLVSCASVEKKRKDCNDKCAAEKTACISKATDAKTKKVDAKKKAECEKNAKACGDKCAAIK